MRSAKSLILLAGLILSSAILVSAPPARPVAADDSTPVPTIVTPQVTVVVSTPEVPTVAPPIIHRERTALPVSTQPAPTAPVAPVVAIPTSTPAIVPTPAAPTIDPSTYDPSPAELRLNARLRWGDRVPRAVRRWAFLVVPAARRYNLDPNLVAAVITMESGGDPTAWNSGSDARGLMQVLHGPFDPRQNIDTGASMLAGFLHEFHDLSLALAAYNAGPGAVLQYGGIPPYRETRDYVIIVTYLYDLYSHRSLNPNRKSQYRATVRDLHRFANQRKKIELLSQTAGTQEVTTLRCTPSSPCERSFEEKVFPTMDPLWPMPGPPDPLQHVGTSVPPR